MRTVACGSPEFFIARQSLTSSPLRSKPASLALGLSAASEPLLERLKSRGQAAVISRAEGRAAALLQRHWHPGEILLVIGAVGAVTRLIAPLIQGKERDPAVLVLDPDGQWVIPLLGGHSGGAERRARELAAELQGAAVITGACASEGRLALDAFGEAWGWTRSGSIDAWRAVMQQQAGKTAVTVHQSQGNRDWLTNQDLLQSVDAESDAAIRIGPERTEGCAWHPASLWLGVGCERGTSLKLVKRAIQEALDEAGLAVEAVAGLASADRKADEAALQELTTSPAMAIPDVRGRSPQSGARSHPIGCGEGRDGNGLGGGSISSAGGWRRWPPTPTETHPPCRSETSSTKTTNKVLSRWRSRRRRSPSLPNGGSCI